MKLQKRITAILLVIVLALSIAPSQTVHAAMRCDAAQFVSDISVPDGTRFSPGTTFTKTWRLKNVGTCTWTTSYSIAFVSGSQMGAPASVNLPKSVAPGETVDVTVTMTAPATAGTYIGYWKLKNASGQWFGIGTNADKSFWVEIVVSGSTPVPGTCTDRATFVSDVTIPDGTVLAPNTAFTKTWRIKNSGTCTWNNSYQAIYQSGEKFGSNLAVNFSNSVAPGQTIDISVNMTSPASAGRYRGYWILKNASGLLYGIGTNADKPFWVEIVVSGPTPVPGACTDRATFVSDVTIPDGTTFAPNTAFTKTWRIKNSGTCTWNTSYQAAYQSGEKMGSVNSVNFTKSVAPGQTIDISVNMVSPGLNGNYFGYWNLKNASGASFGIGSNANKPFWVEINVSGGTTSVPTTPSPTVVIPTAVPGASVYDFVANACNAQWISGWGILPCPGTNDDARGFILPLTAPKLENGTTDSRPGLLTFPQSGSNTYIKGIYPAFRIENGDRFQASIGCEYGASFCYVGFRLDYQIGSGSVQNYWTFNEKYEGLSYNADIDLSPLAGNDVKFILTVLSNGASTGDRALWVAPRIVRPASSATSTPTATFTPTNTPIPATATLTATIPATATFTATSVPASATPTVTMSPTETATDTPLPPTETPTLEPSLTPTP